MLKEIVAECWRFLLFVWRRLQTSKARQAAAALTYTTLFALVPMMAVSYVVLSLMPSLQEASGQIEGLIFEHLLPTSGGAVQEYLVNFSTQARRLTVPGIVMLIITSLLMLKTIENTFNDIWDVQKSRQGISSFLLYWAVLSLGPLLAGGGLMMSTYLMSLNLLGGVTEMDMVKPFMVYLPFVFVTLALCLLYVAVPNCRVRFRHALFGAVVAGLCFEVAKKLFTLIITKSSYTVIYGAFAAVPIFLIWVYLCWMIVLFGAVLVRSISIFRISRGHNYNELVLTLLVLQVFWRKQQVGESVKEGQLIRGVGMGVGVLGVERWHRLRDLLGERGLIGTTSDGDYVLLRDLHSVTVNDVAQWFGADYTQQRKALPPDVVKQEWLQNVLEGFTAVENFSREQLSEPLSVLFEKG